jgi:hypothetical protein
MAAYLRLGAVGAAFSGCLPHAVKTAAAYAYPWVMSATAPAGPLGAVHKPLASWGLGALLQRVGMTAVGAGATATAAGWGFFAFPLIGPAFRFVRHFF